MVAVTPRPFINQLFNVKYTKMRKTKFRNEESKLNNSKLMSLCNNEISHKQIHAIKGGDGDGNEFILTEELIDF